MGFKTGLNNILIYHTLESIPPNKSVLVLTDIRGVNYKLKISLKTSFQK